MIIKLRYGRTHSWRSFEVLTRHLPKKTEVSLLSQYSRKAGLDSNQIPPEFKCRIWPRLPPVLRAESQLKQWP